MEGPLACILASVAAVCALGAARSRHDVVLSKRLEAGRPTAVGGGRGGALSWIGSSAMFSRLPDRPDLGRRLVGIGREDALDRTMGAKVVLGSAAMIASFLVPTPGPLLAPLLGVAGYRVPDLLATRAARARTREIDREVPLLLDLLAAASSAGLSAHLALRAAAGGLGGPLGVELEGVLRSVDLGARWRDEMIAFADRLALTDLRRCMAILTRTETLGTSLAGSIRALAGEVRETRRAAASERARKAPVKMLFPLVFLVLPAFLLLTVVPVLVTTLESIR